MNSQKTYWSLLPVILLFFLTACEMDSTPTPTPVFVGCSESDLIQAIKDANANVDPTIINLDGSCEYTFNVVEDSSNLDFMTHHSGLPAITTEITIQGNGAVLDIQKNPGEPFFGHFFVNGTSGGDLALYQLTLSGGNRQLGGSVINASGDFFASGVRFVDNLAYSSNNSIAKGGAIFSSSGRVRVINGSEFQNNLAGETIANGVNKGGAIYSRNDNLLVSDSSFMLTSQPEAVERFSQKR